MIGDRVHTQPEENYIVFALDFDGCVFNAKFHEEINQHEVELKKKFKQEIQEEVNLYYSASNKRFLRTTLQEFVDAAFNLAHVENNNVTEENLDAFIAYQKEKVTPFVTGDKEEFFTVFNTLHNYFKQSFLLRLEEKKIKLETALFDANKSLFDFITDTIAQGHYDHVYFTVASNRQSKESDQYNGYWTGSAYTAMELIHRYIQRATDVPCDIDGYLIADANGHRPPGENFQKIINREPYDFSHYFFDKDKGSIVYSQTHRAENLHKNANVTYYFIDNENSILQHLTSFYSDNDDLTAKKVQSHFFHYDGGRVELFAPQQGGRTYIRNPIPGKGVLDEHYLENTNYLIECCGEDPTTVPKDGNFSTTHYFNTINRAALFNFKKFRKQSINALLEELHVQIEKLSLDPFTGQSQKLLIPFIATVTELLQVVKADVTDQRAQGRRDDEIFSSPALGIARETLEMLCWYRDENKSSFFPEENRQHHLQMYLTKCADMNARLHNMTVRVANDTAYISCLRTGFLSNAWAWIAKMYQKFIDCKPIAAIRDWRQRKANLRLFDRNPIAKHVHDVQHQLDAMIKVEKKDSKCHRGETLSPHPGRAK